MRVRLEGSFSRPSLRSVSWYPEHSQHLVLKGRYAYGHQNSPGMAALGAVPLVISTPGATQLATLQGNIAF